MFALTVFSEDPSARYGTLMIDPDQVESMNVTQRRVAHGGVADVMVVTTKSGESHIVYGTWETANDLLSAKNIVEKLFERMWKLFDEIVKNSHDVVWADDHTTIHEALCDVADEFSPQLCMKLEKRLASQQDSGAMA